MVDLKKKKKPFAHNNVLKKALKINFTTTH